jgi:hypothetical protein
MIIYISGPMTGIEDNNRAAFFAKEKELLKQFIRLRAANDFEIINPFRIGKEVDYQYRFQEFSPLWEDYMRACIKELLRAEYIVYLPGSDKSRGAQLEKYIAQKLGIKDLKTFKDLRDI